MIRALNVEVDSKYQWESQRKLINYFGKKIKNLSEYPNGIRLRFVKNKKDGINTVEKGKIERLRARQKVFLQNIVTSTTWDIIQLDYAQNSSQPTLRQMIMSLTTGEDNIPLFHCVDLDWRGEGFIFQYSPSVKVEAECTMNTLLPLLKHQHPLANVEKYFAQNIIDKCDGYEFDEIQGIVVDKNVNDHLTFIDEDNLLGFSLTISPDGAAEENNTETRPSAPALYNDSDSVSTLANPGRASFITPPTNATTYSRVDSRNNDNTSVTSNTSAFTIDTIHTMESSIAALTTRVANSDKKFDEIMNYLRSQAGGQASSPIDQTCTTADRNLEAGDDSQSISGNVQ
jgi:hypothetical protein